jgi:hypothetical protein
MQLLENATSGQFQRRVQTECAAMKRSLVRHNPRSNLPVLVQSTGATVADPATATIRALQEYFPALTIIQNYAVFPPNPLGCSPRGRTGAILCAGCRKRPRHGLVSWRGEASSPITDAAILGGGLVTQIIRAPAMRFANAGYRGTARALTRRWAN